MQTIRNGLQTLSAAVGAEGGDLSCWQPSQPFLSPAERSPGAPWNSPAHFQFKLPLSGFCFTGGTEGVLAGVTPLTQTGKLVSTATDGHKDNAVGTALSLLVCSP